MIDIIDYAEDEKDAEGLRGLMARKSKERDAKKHQRKILREYLPQIASP